MLSPEPFTAAPTGGYRCCSSTGETFEDEPLHDRQHPHDLFMELALSYSHYFSAPWGVLLYAAPAGEPALGPVAFPAPVSAGTTRWPCWGTTGRTPRTSPSGC
jgi:hypothetical protein